MDRELSKKIRHIQIQATHLAENILAGAYRSAFQGKGMEFEEVRAYQAGDEIRHIDWNVTARMNHLYVKNFREEREMTVILLVDISASSRFSSQARLKSELMAEIGAVLAFSAVKSQDRVGLILFSNQIEGYLPPKKGIKHALRVVRELLTFSPQQVGTDLGTALAFLGKVQRKAAICFLISDFFATNYEHHAKLTAQAHDLISIGIRDPLEMHFPSLGLLNVQDLETKRVALIDSNQTSPFLSETLQKGFIEAQLLMKKIGAEFIEIRMDQPYLPILRRFFKTRRKRQ